MKKKLKSDSFKDYFSDISQYEYYEQYKSRVRKIRNIEDCFICLKGVASSTPLVNSAVFNSNSVGGGFYFRFNGTGIVVDPGLGYVELLHRNNIFIDDIDVVIVTHNHIDHNADIKALSSLLYDFNRNRRRKYKFYEGLFDVNKAEHVIEWYLDESTINSIGNDISNERIHRLSELAKNGYSNVVDDIFLEVFNTRHITSGNKYIEDSYGIKLKFTYPKGGYIWGYTSDTSYFKEINTYLADCDVGILNISDIYPKDVAEEKPKSTHLGYFGCRNIISNTDMKIYLITEFCCTNGDARFEIVKKLNSKFISQKKIMVLEKSMKISLDGRKIECNICGAWKDINKSVCIKNKVDGDNVIYVCRECLM